MNYSIWHYESCGFLRCYFLSLLFFGFLSSSASFSLPIGFGFNQDEAKYNEIKTRNFVIYHDSRVPHEGAMIANALEAVKPTLDRWFGIRRKYVLPVISSALSANPSFANFITDAIELQTLGEGNRDLFWHEYVHTMTYQHFHNFFGPAGSLLHLPWVPAWFLEGLAEALTASVGSDVQASVERYQALTGKWPGFDRLHSLYSSPSFFLRGYSTAGGFVAWLLKGAVKRNGDLGHLLRQLYRYTTPTYYLQSFNPLSRFMPMDAVLRDFLKKDARELYEIYKAEARKHWLSQKRGPFLRQHPGNRLILPGSGPIFREQNEYFMVFKNAGGRKEKMRLIFDEKTGWMIRAAPTGELLPENPGSLHHISRPSLHLGVTSEPEATTGRSQKKLVLYRPDSDGSPAQAKTIVRIKDEVFGLVETPDKIVWMEKEFEKTRLCFLSKKHLRSGRFPVPRNHVVCPVRQTMPGSLRLLGDRKQTIPAIGIFPYSKKDRGLSTELWLAIEEQTLAGNRSRLVVWNAAENSTRQMHLDGGGGLLQAVPSPEGVWYLLAGRDRRFLRKADQAGNCLGELHFEDLITHLAGAEDGSLVLTLLHGQQSSILRFQPAALKLKACRQSPERSSPLLWAMQQNRPTGLPEALQKGSPWRSSLRKEELLAGKNSRVIASGLDKAKTRKGEGVTAADSRNASWRPRPVLGFPWIGADDALGSQLGLISVPLMDHLQNETVRLSSLYGLASRFPNTELTLTSTRFWPTVDISAYRRQLWNGACRDVSDGSLYTSYLDEKGVHSKITIPWFFREGKLNLSIGLRSGHLRRYLGPCISYGNGRINEPYLALHSRVRKGRALLSWNVKVKAAPEGFNQDLDYDVLAAGFGLSLPIPLWRLSLDLGLEGSRTRGKKAMTLKEVYQPLKTFVAGSGGGYNQNNFPLTPGGSLLTIRYGDTQARFNSSLTVPVIPALEKQIWLFYLQRLNFAAFYSYGGAWQHGMEDVRKKLLSAHGYRLDLLFENKGVGFNLSLGSGQVVADIFQLYASFGFDAFF